MNKKTIALMLSFSMVLSGMGISAMPEKAAAADKDIPVGLELATGGSIDTPTGGSIENPDQSEETKEPAGETTKPDETKEPAEETKAPENSPAASQPAASETPAAGTTATPAAVSTATPAGITTPTALNVGDRFTTGNFIYSVLTTATDTAKATVKIRGLSAEGKTKTSLTIAASVKWQATEYLITGINEKSFKNNKNLTSVKVGKNVTYIGKYAFQGMTSLSSVTIGSGVTKIKKYAFAGCKKLRKVTIPAKTTFIGEKAFQNCKALKAVIVNSKKISKINSNAFRYVKSGCYMVVPSGKKNTYKSLLQRAKASKIKLYVY